MPKSLQIGNTIYSYPTEGDNPGWGEDATEWATGVTEALEGVQGPNDILLTSATLANNQTTSEDIPGLVFNTGEVQSIKVEYFIIRVFDSGAITVTESGEIIGDFNGTNFSISNGSVGDAGVTLSVTNSGQFQYVSSNLVNHVSTTIRFKAKTIDLP